MIKSKTYNIVGNYIQASELAYTSIYVVKKDGLQHDLYGTAFGSDPNRVYSYDSAAGKITFGTEGEKAFVIYKESSPVGGPIPGVCIPVTIEDSIMPDAIVNVSYSKSFPLNGAAPFTLNVIQKPSWAAVEISLFGVVTVMGFPDVAGPEVLEFSVSNCGGSTSPLLKTFNTLANSNNLFVSTSSFSRIDSVTGLLYVITGGSFPVSVFSGVLSGIHDAYTGTITASVSSVIFPRSLRLQKNGVTLESIAVSSNGLYVFASQSYLSADIIQIQLT